MKDWKSDFFYKNIKEEPRLMTNKEITESMLTDYLIIDKGETEYIMDDGRIIILKDSQLWIDFSNVKEFAAKKLEKECGQKGPTIFNDK